ncbi:type IV secretory system conjugative DNA transfer family protein [Acidisoma silvae]|uniref:Type IV secretory system conjugative DNA transfer family protein n=1 Tax=Acidisoma silvae TaxID=2802396 RepID=A0A964E1L4_9PROT|nr:type IV secretory system conjugative DNA transfer family protein [Acidisoma silvae]
MLEDPLRGHRFVARTATTHLGRPKRERASVLSTAIRHTAWLDDPRLAATLNRTDFDLRDRKRRRMTVYIALPPSSPAALPWLRARLHRPGAQCHGGDPEQPGGAGRLLPR